MEGKLPQHNTRVKLPMTSDRLAVYDGKLGSDLTLVMHERGPDKNGRCGEFKHFESAWQTMKAYGSLIRVHESLRPSENKRLNFRETPVKD